MSDPQNETTDPCDHHIRQLMVLMLKPDQITAQLLEYIEAGEYGLALEELAFEVMGVHSGSRKVQALVDDNTAARRVVAIARVYKDWMFGGAIEPQDKKELIEAVDAYDEVVQL